MKRSKRSFPIVSLLFVVLLSLSIGSLNARNALRALSDPILNDEALRREGDRNHSYVSWLIPLGRKRRRVSTCVRRTQAQLFRSLTTDCLGGPMSTLGGKRSRGKSGFGKVEMWRGGFRPNISVAASFVWRCLSGSAMTPFPHPAHRTGQADLPHPALGQDFTP